MTLLIIGYVVYSILAIPSAVHYAGYVLASKESSPLASTLGFLAQVFAAITLIMYMHSIGHGIVALILLLPAIVGILIGFVVALVENS